MNRRTFFAALGVVPLIPIVGICKSAVPVYGGLDLAGSGAVFGKFSVMGETGPELFFPENYAAPITITNIINVPASDGAHVGPYYDNNVIAFRTKFQKDFEDMLVEVHDELKG